MSDVRMIDVSEKPVMKRTAKARAEIAMSPATVKKIRTGTIPKGDVLGVARTAGILASKQTAHLLPLCHPLLFEHVSVEFAIKPKAIHIETHIVGFGRTGFEMEALVAATTAALTIYDMCKGVDPHMVISEIEVVQKTKALLEGRGGAAKPAPGKNR